MFTAVTSGLASVALGEETNTYVFMTPLAVFREGVGEDFTVDINILNSKDLHSSEFSVLYDSSFLDVIEVVQGAFFPSPLFEFIEDHEAGLVNVTISVSQPELSLEGNGTIAQIVFNITETSPPESEISFNSVELWNVVGDPISFDRMRASVFIGMSLEEKKAMQTQEENERRIDIYTPKGGQGPSEPMGVYRGTMLVTVIANVTYNNWPEQNTHVAFQVLNPLNETVLVVMETTNEEGIANMSFRIPSIPESLGTWTVFATVDVACRVVLDFATFFVPSLVVGGHTFSPSTTRQMGIYVVLVILLATFFISLRQKHVINGRTIEQFFHNCLPK